jgi:IclR family pca regulon transcriptional regulator
LRSHLHPLLRSLVKDVNETVAGFAILEGCNILYVEQMRARSAPFGVDIRSGATIPATQSAVGRAILAFLPPEELTRTLSLQPHRIVARQGGEDEFFATLPEIRRRGYALMSSLFEKRTSFSRHADPQSMRISGRRAQRRRACGSMLS